MKIFRYRKRLPLVFAGGGATFDLIPETEINDQQAFFQQIVEAITRTTDCEWEMVEVTQTVLDHSLLGGTDFNRGKKP